MESRKSARNKKYRKYYAQPIKKNSCKGRGIFWIKEGINIGLWISKPKHDRVDKLNLQDNYIRMKKRDDLHIDLFDEAENKFKQHFFKLLRKA